MYDCLVIGAGASGLSCALILGSAKEKEFAKDKKIAIIAHQRASHLSSALFNNVLGLRPGTLGTDILKTGIKQLNQLYPQIEQIHKEKVTEIEKIAGAYKVITNKNAYYSKIVVIAVGYTNLFNIKGLNQYIEPHPRSNPEKERIWLKNTDHLISKGLYVSGTLAGWRSQYAMACGSGAHVATDILTLWNNGKETKIHDKI